MKLDLKYVFIGLEGEAAKFNMADSVDKEGNPIGLKSYDLTLSHIMKEALNHVTKENNIELAKLVQRGMDIMSITKGDCPDWSLDQWIEFKSMVKDVGRPPIILAQVDMLIINAAAKVQSPEEAAA